MPELNPAMDVIRAARDWFRAHPDSEDANTALNELAAAVQSLNSEIEDRRREDGVEIPARIVCPGDQIKGRNGQWIEVLSVRTDSRDVVIGIAGKTVWKGGDDILTVRRGPEGIVADMLGSDMTIGTEGP